jgi:hypothetical protein
MTCPEKYKNLGLSSFGEQKYVTEEMLKQFCMNDAWLKKKVDSLEYLTPPAVRKRFKPIPIDESKSFGYEIGSDGTIKFDTETYKNYNYDFFNMDVIDESKTTAVLRSELDNDNTVTKQFAIPTSKNCETTIKKNTTRNYSPWTIYETDDQGNIIWEDANLKIPKIKSDDMTCNEHWYIGFDRNRTYETRPNWLKNMMNPEIPGIARAQTFKAKSSGQLNSVVLNLKGSTNTGMPLIVQIRKTKLENGIYVPVNTAEPQLASQEVVFWNTDPGVYSVTFDNPATVETGKTYAIVLASPLSHPTNCYWVGGWNKHCHADQYEDGDAFYSFNSGYTWIRYGKDDWETGEEVEYHAGKYAPQDFAFQCHIEERKTTCETVYDTNKNYYVYLKPIFSNPIKSVKLSASDKGDTAGNKYSIKYQISPTGGDNDWTDIKSGEWKNFSVDPNTGEYSHMLFVRAILKTTDNKETPLLQSISLDLNTTLPKEMYIRTHPYSPPLNGILSADVWGRIYAPFTNEETVEGNVEIIRDYEVMEHFIIIKPSDLINYTHLKEIDENKVKGKTETAIRKYLTDNPSVVKALQENQQIYIIDYFTSIKLKNSPAYPLISASLQPSKSATVYFGEWYDFLTNYTGDTLTFTENALSKMDNGALTIKYNPLFLDQLSNEEVGTGDGLVLDYFQEDFIITEEEIEKRQISLRATPVDPIRKIIIVKSTDYDDSEEDIELIEDVDYTVDYTTKVVTFKIVYTDEETTMLEPGDHVRVVYTPNLDDSALSIGYHFKRTNTAKQAKVSSNWIEYKA